MNQLDQHLERNFKKLYLGMLTAAALVYVVFSLKTPVWADEAYTFALIRHSYTDIWTITAADSHPPLFYFFMKFFSAPFGYHLMVSRMVASLPCLALMAIAGWQLRKLFGTRTGLLFMLLYFLYPYLMDYTVEVRMYSLAELLIFLNALYAYRCWKWNRPKDWAIFALAGTGAALTHYFALVSAGLIYALFFLVILAKNRKLLKGWSIASAATIVVYLPWLGNLISQLIFKANNEYWIAPITLSTLAGYVKDVFYTGAMQAYFLYLGAAYVIALVVLLASGKKDHIGLCLCALAIPLGTVAVGVIASIILRPVFVLRYVVPALPLAVFFFAFVLGHLSNEMLLSSLLTVCLIGGVTNLAVTAKNAILTDPQRLTVAMVDQFPDCDAYVVRCGNELHASQELCYIDPVTPVYTSELLGPDNPYPNRVDYAAFRPEEHPSIILVLQEGEDVPEDYLAHYSAEFLCTVNVSGTYESLWHLVQPEAARN